VAKGKNLEDEAKIMIEIAIAKGWDLKKIKTTGSDEFKKIIAKIISQKLNEFNENKEDNKLEVKSEKIDSYINSKLERVNVSGGDGGEVPIDKDKEKTDFYPSFKPKLK
jgi:hypothetical protein